MNFKSGCFTFLLVGLQIKFLVFIVILFRGVYYATRINECKSFYLLFSPPSLPLLISNDFLIFSAVFRHERDKVSYQSEGERHTHIADK